MSVLVPCPGCKRVTKADEGHHLCRACEGYPVGSDDAYDNYASERYESAVIGGDARIIEEVPGE